MGIKDSCSCWLICAISFLAAVAIALIIVGSTGAVIYASEKHDESVYKPTMCFVKDYERDKNTCSSASCKRIGRRKSCITRYYTCYTEVYTVIYNISDDRTIESTTKGSGRPGKNSVSTLFEFEAIRCNEKALIKFLNFQLIPLKYRMRIFTNALYHISYGIIDLRLCAIFCI